MRILTVFSLFFSLYSYGQQLSNCKILLTLFDSKIVKRHFRIENSSDTLLLIDKGNDLLGKCSSFIWGRNNVEVIYDKELSKKISSSYPYFLYRGQCKTFIIDSFVQ